MALKGTTDTQVQSKLRAAHIPYAIDNQSIRVVNGGLTPMAQLDNMTFFTESFIDELAHRAGTNPQFRMELLHKHPRHQQVLQVAAEAAGWRNLPDGRAWA